jgi:ABC-type branched-subunit amino acid transport system substrate-binding protein
LGLCAAFAACKHPGRGPQFLGDTRDLDASRVDPAFRDDWVELERAREANPASDEVLAAADRLLARDPPLPVRLSALRAKAEHAYLRGDDPSTIAIATDALSQVEVDPARPAPIVVELARLRAQGLARGGDPPTALAALDDPLLAPPDRLSEDTRWGLVAVALDRNADHPAAVAAYASWRATLPDDDAATAWAEHRLRVLAGALDEAGWATALDGMSASPAQACLVAMRDAESPPSGSPPWVAACASAATEVGVLLPRSGKLAALSDTQLAAAMTAIEVLADQPAAQHLLFADAGSSKTSARRAAQSLVAQGAGVVVGPMGAANVAAVVEEVGDGVAVIVPGEGRGKAIGVAPTLERRVARLVESALAAGKKRLVVLAPDNAYGKRAVAAVHATAKGRFAKAPVVKRYPGATTSFKPVLDSVMPALSSDAALLVADHLPRTEGVVRQLLRSGKVPARESATGLWVMTTAEGTDPDLVARAGDVLEGVWASPVAAIGADAQAFADAYAAREGALPGDQALLVFYAVRRAVAGSAMVLETDAPLVRFQGGAIVQETAATR